MQVTDTISVLRGIKGKYEDHHRIRISDGALISAAELSNRSGHSDVRFTIHSCDYDRAVLGCASG